MCRDVEVKLAAAMLAQRRHDRVGSTSDGGGDGSGETAVVGGAFQ
jgi:hypothetical protein